MNYFDMPVCPACTQRHDPKGPCVTNTPHINVQSLPQVQRKVRLVLKNGLTFDATVSKDFNLGALVTSIRANGFLLTPELYVPDDLIGPIFEYKGELTDKPAQVINFPDNPKP